MEEYKYGFTTDIEVDELPKGLSEDIVREISRRKKEPEFMLEARLKAYRYWLTMKEPTWAHVSYPPIDYQGIRYFSAPKKATEEKKSLNDLDPELLKTFERLGIPLNEQKRISGVAVDAVFDSVSIGTTHQDTLREHGVIFCSISEILLSASSSVFSNTVIRIFTPKSPGKNANLASPNISFKSPSCS